jgi:hypothetical protein
MTPDMLSLKSIRAPRLDNTMLLRAVSRLGKLTEGKESAGTISSSSLLKDFRQRMREGLSNGKSFEECTRGRRREWLLLSLYLNDLGSEESRAWLPPLDSNVAVSILGEDPGMLKRHLLRLATQLYFTHYGRERLPCLESISLMLELAWRSASQEKFDPISRVWAENAQTLFAVDAPDKVAQTWKAGMSVHELADAFQIHQGGLFRERLLESLILSRLRRLPLNNNDLELNDLVVSEKERKLKTSLPLGAAAVQILVNRSQNENSSMVPENWAEQIVTYACDPRIPNNEMQARWWGWATGSEKDVAIRALSKITLKEFIRLLESSLVGTPQSHQFVARRDLLLDFFEKGLVIDARLVIPNWLYQSLNVKVKNVLNPSWVGGGQATSFICLRCKGEVYLIEGTHSFSLRGFIGADAFPIKGYWNKGPRQYSDPHFRVHKDRCDIYQKHQGSWVWGVMRQIRSFVPDWDI